MEQMQAAFNRFGHILKSDRFSRIVADSARSSEEDHRGRNFLRQDHCIMTGSAHHVMRLAAGFLDPSLIREIEQAIRKAGCDPHHMVSGAGHDAMILAEKVPAAMIFLRTPGGISHDPAESVALEDVAKAIECGLHLLHQLASSPTSRQKDVSCITLVRREVLNNPIICC